MNKKINFSDGSYIQFQKGRIDKWCVYYYENVNKPCHAPTDKDMFIELADLAKDFGVSKVYDDFVLIYEKTTKNITKEAKEQIRLISDSYGNSSLNVHKLFSKLYMSMIAEENKNNTKLGKRIKRLGIHCLLNEKMSIDKAAKFMIKKSWTTISEMCSKCGF